MPGGWWVVSSGAGAEENLTRDGQVAGVCNGRLCCKLIYKKIWRERMYFMRRSRASRERESKSRRREGERDIVEGLAAGGRARRSRDTKSLRLSYATSSRRRRARWRKQAPVMGGGGRGGGPPTDRQKMTGGR